MENPFNYLQLATGDQFYDRIELRRDLRSRFLSGQSSVVLYGPRRYGKSSLVAELVRDLEKAGIPCVTLDVMKVPSIDLFVSAYAAKVYRRLAPVRFEFKKLGTFLKSLRPKMTIGPSGEASLTFEPFDAPIGPEALSEVLDLPQRLLSGKGRAVVVFDEFQEVKDLLPSDGFERTMRSAVQSHRNVSYIFLGSRHHLLRRMFTDHNRPFYRSAVTIQLDKPPLEESVRFVVDRFASAGKTIAPETAELLVGRIENIPYFIQQLGFETFRIVDDARRKSVLPADVEAAYSNLSGFNRDQYEQLMLTLSASQKKLLIALAHEKAAEFSEAYRRKHMLGVSSTVNSNKAKLMEDGLLELADGQYTVADPFFAQFLRMV